QKSGENTQHLAEFSGSSDEFSSLREILRQFFHTSGKRPLKPGEVRFGQWISPQKQRASVDSTTEMDAGGAAAESFRESPPPAGESLVLTLEPIGRIFGTITDYQQSGAAGSSTTGLMACIHCHGGDAAVAAILGDLTRIGVRAIDTWDGHGAFHASAPSSLCTHIAADARTKKTFAIAMGQLQHGLHVWADRHRRSLAANPSGAQSRGIVQQASELLQLHPEPVPLVLGPLVVIAGSPNVGKSTLLNRLLGFQRAITAPVAGTTRDLVAAETVIGGFPIRFADTAGIRALKHSSDDESPMSQREIEAMGIQRACDAIRSANVVLVVRDAAGNESDESMENRWLLESLDASPARRIDVWNKSDLAADPSTQTRVRAGDVDVHADSIHSVRCSAKNGDGIEQLQDAILDVARLRDLVPNQPVPLCGPQVTVLRRIADADCCDVVLQHLQALVTGNYAADAQGFN
ncbi:MAG: GTPase, partial [Planctomycetota bacterium]